MNTRLLSLAAAGLMALAARPATAQSINFDDGTSGAAIGAFYSSSGVTFSNAEWSNAFGCCSVRSILEGFQPTPGNPIIAIFSSAVSVASLEGQDVGSRGYRLSAYDAQSGGSLVDQATFTGVGLGVGTNATLSVSAPDIWRIEFSQNTNDGTSDGMVFDNLSYREAVATPEPASLVLLATGLAGVAGFARRERKST